MKYKLGDIVYYKDSTIVEVSPILHITGKYYCTEKTTITNKDILVSKEEALNFIETIRINNLNAVDKKYREDKEYFLSKIKKI